ncbi:XRE family transcriptional regulator [Nonomuraea ferruginea]
MPGVLAGGADVNGRHGAALPEPTELRTPSLHPDKNVDSEEDENILRRALLNLLNNDAGATKLTGPVLGACEGIRRRMDYTLVSSSVSPAMLDQWEEATLAFGRQYTTTAPLRLLCDVLLELSAVRNAMTRRQPIDLQERLCRMAAQLSGLSGMIMINLGDHRLARSFFRTGRTAADETGDRALRAWVTAREALVPLYYGDAREALNLAKKSRDLAGQTPCAAQAMAPVVEARALAMLSGTDSRKEVVDQAKRALARARSAFSHIKGKEREDMAFGYTEKQLYFYQGDVLTKLGQTLEADLVLDQALHQYQDHILDQTLIRLDQAQCRLIEGESGEALRIGTEALRLLGPEYRTDFIMRPALALAQAIRAREPAHPGLAAYEEQLRPPQPVGGEGAQRCMRIRRYRWSDLDTILTLHQICLAEVGLVPGDGVYYDDDFPRIQEIYLACGGDFLVGETGGRVVAMGGLKPVDSATAEVSPAARAPGVPGARLWLRHAFRARTARGRAGFPPAER